MSRNLLIVAVALVLAACAGPQGPNRSHPEAAKVARMVVQGTGGDVSYCPGSTELCWSKLTVRVRITNIGSEPFGVSAGNFTGRTASGLFKTTYRGLGSVDCFTPEVIYPLQGRTCLLEFRFDPRIPDSDLFPMGLGFPQVGVKAEMVFFDRDR